MGKSLVLKVLDRQNNSSKFSLLTFTLVAMPFFVFLLSSYVPAQVIIKEKVEINPQSVIVPDAPLSNHILRVDIQWSPASLPGWIMYYDLNCDQNNYSSASSTTGSNTFSHSSLGYENYQIQFRFGSLDPNQPTITGTYQLYYDEQLIRSESFQAQKATYSSYAYFNTHYQSPVLTDYNFSIFASEICPGSYEDIYITTSRNCNATAEINTELDSITLTIETGREFVSFYKNSQKKDTITFMYHELGSVYLRQDSTYTGTAPINVNIKSDWTGLIKYQQLVINPQEQFQIRVPDQPIIVFSGGVRGFKIETYSSDNCPPFISENLRYTALIKKGSNRGLLYDYDTGNSGDTLTNLTSQEDGEKYLDFITEGEILSQTDTVIVKVFTNDENIDTTEAVIIIYPNEIDVQIIPSVISQGDTARVVLKKRGANGLEDFAADKVFNVMIVQGLDYGLILDSLSNDTLTIFSNIPQGFKIIAKDSTGIDSTKIRIKVSTEESGFPEERMIRNNTKQNKKEIVDDNENQKSDDEIITPDWIIPGPILLEGFGDVVVKEDNCDEEIVVCENLNSQKIDSTNFHLIGANQLWTWQDLDGNPYSTYSNSPCNFEEAELVVAGGATYSPSILGTTEPKYEVFQDIHIETCLTHETDNNKMWCFKVSYIRIPIIQEICFDRMVNRKGLIDLEDGQNINVLANQIPNCEELGNVLDLLNNDILTGPYVMKNDDLPHSIYSTIYMFSGAFLAHENVHLNQLMTNITEVFNGQEGLSQLLSENYKINHSLFNCPPDAIEFMRKEIQELLTSNHKKGKDLKNIYGVNEKGINNFELLADIQARPEIEKIIRRIKTWAKTQQWWDSNNVFCSDYN